MTGSGCASLEKSYGDPLPLDEFEEFETGDHYATVLDRFGPPSKMTALPDGMAFLYEYIVIYEKQFGLVLPGEIGQWVKAIYGSAEATVESMVFVFGDDGSMLGARADVLTADAGSGFSVTLVFSLGSLTDTADYEDSASRPLAWGMRLLQPPFAALNRGQNLESGASGFELSGTAPAVGQHALELRPR